MYIYNEKVTNYINKKYKNHLLLYDNASPHKSLLLRQLIKDSKNILLYCVPYHPETNPIEEFFSQLKHYIRKKSPQDYKEISKEIKNILKTNIKKTYYKSQTQARLFQCCELYESAIFNYYKLVTNIFRGAVSDNFRGQ